MTDVATPSPSITEATFDEALAADDLPVPVDFWAEWCGPCKLVEPVLAEIAALRRGQLRVVWVDADENPGLSLRYDVMSVPTLMLFAGGEPVLRLVGARARGQLLAELDAHLRPD
jgi:thioredoxin 1